MQDIKDNKILQKSNSSSLISSNIRTIKDLNIDRFNFVKSDQMIVNV